MGAELKKLIGKVSERVSAEKVAEWKNLTEEYFMSRAFIEAEELQRSLAMMAHDVLAAEGVCQEDFVQVPSIEARGALYASAEMSLQIIYNSALKGGRGKDILVAAYKAFYSAEYKQLKRFRILDCEALISLSTVSDDNLSRCMLVRYMIMAGFMGIELDDDTIAIYMVIEDIIRDDEFVGRLGEVEEDVNLNVPEGDSEAREDAFLISLDSLCENAYDFAFEVISLALGHFGFPEFYVEHAFRCDSGEFCPDYYQMTEIAYNMLANKGEEITPENVGIAAALLHYTWVFTNTAKLSYIDFLQVCGVLDEKHFFNKTRYSAPPLRKTDAVQGSGNGAANANKVLARSVKEDAGELLEEIYDLKRRLKVSQSAEKSLHDELERVQREADSLRQQLKACDIEKAELVSLKDYVYGLENGCEDEAEISFEDMKAAVSGKKIVIIGGNPNWTKKLKSLFGNWEFVPANASGATSVSLQGAEMVYFFTDTLAHKAYGEFVKKCRNERIKFSYLHGVNMEANVSKIYHDVV